MIDMRVRKGQAVMVGGVKVNGGEVCVIPEARAVHLINQGIVDYVKERAWIKPIMDVCIQQAKAGNPPIINRAGMPCEVPGNQAVKLVAGGKARFVDPPAPAPMPVVVDRPTGKKMGGGK